MGTVTNISSQFIIMGLCVLQGFLKNLKKPKEPRQQAVRVDTTKQEEQKLTKNPQLQQLQSKKKEIQSTIQQFNNPSSFAKYSKMQRQLVKINNRIKALNQNEITSNSSTVISQENPKLTVSQKQEQNKKEDKPENLMPMWFNIVFNIVILSLALTMETSVLLNNSSYPLKLIASQQGRANCIFVYLACKMIIN